MLIVPNHEIDAEFFELCNRHKPNVICDIGTRDCQDAIKMKACSPSSTVFAFEANPENFFDYCVSDTITKSGVIPTHLAISNDVGITKISVPHYASRSEGGSVQQRGMSSILQKVNTSRFVEYPIPTTTIDAFFSYPSSIDESLSFAFWIDVEGFAYEVLSGMTRILGRTLFMKVEVEEREYYSGQKLASDVMELMKASSLVAVKAGDPGPGQYDLLFMSRDIASS
jgi:FkbM family methyltransferase